MRRIPESKNHHIVRDHTYRYRDSVWPPIPTNAIPIQQEQQAKNDHERRKSLH